MKRSPVLQFPDSKNTHRKPIFKGQLDWNHPWIVRALVALDCWAVMHLTVGDCRTPTMDAIRGVRRLTKVSGMEIDLAPATTKHLLTSARLDGLTAGRVMAEHGELFKSVALVFHPRAGNYSYFSGSEQGELVDTEDLSVEREGLKAVVKWVENQLGSRLADGPVRSQMTRVLRLAYEDLVWQVAVAVCTKGTS